MFNLHTPNRSALRRLLPLVLMGALSIPRGASGDEEKTGQAAPKDLYKQIEAAVIAGKITKEEARAKLEALKSKSSPETEAIKKDADKKSDDKAGDDQKTIAHLENIWIELQSLVDAGKMSKDEAASVISTIKQKVFANPSANEKQAKAKPKPNPKPKPKDLYQQIEAAVAAGKITKEEAQAKLEALKKGAPGKQPAKDKQAQTKPNPKDLYQQIEAAVAAGKITKEEAQAKLEALKSRAAPKTDKQDQQAATAAKLKQVWAELQAAVAAGTLTKEEAKAKLNAIKKEKLGGQ